MYYYIKTLILSLIKDLKIFRLKKNFNYMTWKCKTHENFEISFECY